MKTVYEIIGHIIFKNEVYREVANTRKEASLKVKYLLDLRDVYHVEVKKTLEVKEND